MRRFVAENVDLVQRGSTFSQLSAQERETIIERARALADTGLRTVNAVARAVAAENGRAVETIRFDDSLMTAVIAPSTTPIAIDAIVSQIVRSTPSRMIGTQK